MINAKSASGKDGYHNPEEAHISVKVYYTKDVLDFVKGKVDQVKKDVSVNQSTNYFCTRQLSTYNKIISFR